MSSSWPLWVCLLFLPFIYLCYAYLNRPLKFRQLISSPPPGRSVVPKPVTSAVTKIKQPYDVFLVSDFEATCEEGKDFMYPNEIIEFPVFLMKWKDKTENDHASQLEIAAEFHSFVRPSWRPQLSAFCTGLTNITQEKVDAAPDFPRVLDSLRSFLMKQGVIDKFGRRKLKYCWCTDGPWDISHFVVKQAFISRASEWLAGDFVDVRQLVRLHSGTKSDAPKGRLNIPAQLKTLGLEPFIGRQHSGADDARNLGRILTELAVEGVQLRPNTSVNLRRRWPWMGKFGQVLEDHI
ncbi:Exonuclease domain-containing protein [Mycena indigotica]|uniref:Exonuclease domain-containing protein n=1 Tax=Mycena indigotica TaxID=2126181 RepID=A0A8H6VV79_9AGAR|nr:Exonuclease domain-containing protein [Mycena indigotica]KAF7295112.1 Exonuclease domain-containing protein [Mycena indigotica]